MPKEFWNFGQIFDMLKAMRKTLYLLLLVLPVLGWSQDVRLAKGAITDGLKVNDTVAETYAVYLPSNFEMGKPWPVLYVMDLKGRGRQAISMFREAAEQEGYILIASNSVSDTVSLPENVKRVSRLFQSAMSLLPLHKNRTYTGGFGDGARFASILPSLFPKFDGVLSCGAALGNAEVLSAKNPFHFVAVVSNMDYSYMDLLMDQKVLNTLKMPNHIIVHDGTHAVPSTNDLAMALQFLTLKAIPKGHAPKNNEYIQQTYDSLLSRANELFTADKPLLAENILENMMDVFRTLLPTDPLKTTHKTVKRSKNYRSQLRSNQNAMSKESFVRDDYGYYLEEDVLTYNFNNLGWWKFQMDELAKLEKSNDRFEQHMASRLRGFINALIYDNMNIINNAKMVDTQALSFLHMLKTITEPSNYDYYLKIISNSAEREDYGTALFYLEELLKNGYTDKKSLYELEHTALLRITPEFNDIVNTYLKEARYDFIKE
jgi:hypothetical protein